MPAGSVDLAFADPPFNIGYKYDEYDDRLESQKYLDWSRDWIRQVHRVLSDTGAFWLAIGDEYAAELKVESHKIGFHMRSWVVWYYTFGVHCRQKFTRSHAHLFHFVKDPKKFVFNPGDVAVPSARQLVYGDKRANPKGRMPDDTWILRPQDCVDGFTADEDVWYFPRVAGTFKERAGFHGCQMPEQLIGRIVRSCSNPGELVMDPFTGSGTTLTVAKKLGREFAGFELSKDYAKLAQQRLDSANVGDHLEGSAEPQASAPSTYSAKARRSKNTPPDTRGLDDLFEYAGLEDGIDGIIQAFAETNRGFSVDRLVADPLLNEDFQTKCDRISVPGTPAERNRFLFAIRKSGKLIHAGINTKERTTIQWDEMDPYLFASEIAWRNVSQLYGNAGLDEILCDPRLANQFDQTADQFAGGYTPLQYRWAALKIRKQSSVGRRHADECDLPLFDESDWKTIEKLRLKNVPPNPGVYAIRDGDEFLYAGETLNLQTRLKCQLSGTAIEHWPSNHQDLTRIEFAVQKIDSVPDVKLAHQSRLVKCYHPAWNFERLFA